MKKTIFTILTLLASTSIYARTISNISPQETISSKNIIQQKEIKEFFWFDCSVCASLNKHVSAWDDRTDNAFINHIPVVWDYETEQEAKIFQAFKSLSKVKKIDMTILLDELFEMKILKHKKMSLSNLMPLLEKYNISKNEFITNLNSISNLMTVNNYKKLTEEFNISSVPTFIINNEKLSRADVKNNSDLFILFNKKIID